MCANFDTLIFFDRINVFQVLNSHLFNVRAKKNTKFEVKYGQSIGIMKSAGWKSELKKPSVKYEKESGNRDQSAARY